jgi:hypothetical protein
MEIVRYLDAGHGPLAGIQDGTRLIESDRDVGIVGEILLSITSGLG